MENQAATTNSRAPGFFGIYKRTIIIICSILLVALSIVLFVIIYLIHQHISLRTMITTRKGAIVTNGLECARIGRMMIYKGGGAVDAAIAALLCDGITNPESMGIGGGFLMTIYNRETKTSTMLNAREVAPENAYANMFKGDSKLAKKGGLSIAVPGEVRGYWFAHQKFGKLPWATLIEPNIKLCRRGHLVTPYLAAVFKKNENEIRESPGLSEVFINPETKDIYRSGSALKRPGLANTLEIIAKHGADALYDGVLTPQLVEEIVQAKGIFTMNDMKTYKPLFGEPIHTTIQNNLHFYSVNAPGSGGILALILNVLKDSLTLYNINSGYRNWQTITETFKFAYGARFNLGDPNFEPGVTNLTIKLGSHKFADEIRRKISFIRTYTNPDHYYPTSGMGYVEDHGTGNVAVLAPNGDAVVATSTINYVFGSGIRSQSTGIILNDEMDDFSSPNITNVYNLPPFPNNFIKPGKRPASSMCPSIITDQNGDVVMAVGAAGGTKITSSVAQVIMRKLWFQQSLKEAIKAPRIHHQLLPMVLEYEKEFDKKVLEELKAAGHRVRLFSGEGFVATTAISREGDNIEAEFDPRRGGSALIIGDTPKYYGHKSKNK